MPKMLKFMVSDDKSPKYTVKDVAKMMGLSAYTIRYYENSELIPGVQRTNGNVRKFSEYALNWLRLVHCLRATGLPINGVRHYIHLCKKGESTIPERAAIIFAQEKNLKEQILTLNGQMKVLKYKKHFYERLLKGTETDRCNPAVFQNVEEAMMKV